jgi:hypothetical protein
MMSSVTAGAYCLRFPHLSQRHRLARRGKRYQDGVGVSGSRDRKEREVSHTFTTRHLLGRGALLCSERLLNRRPGPYPRLYDAVITTGACPPCLCMVYFPNPERAPVGVSVEGALSPNS